MDKLKIGVIGTGNISNVHLGGYAKNPRVEIYALCDIKRERALEKAKKYGVPESRVFDNAADMLALPELDAVSVCTWNSQHAPCTICLLYTSNIHKHIFRVCTLPDHKIG